MNRTIQRVAGLVIFAVGLAGLIFLYSGRVDWGAESVWNWRCVAGVGIFGGGALIGQSFRQRPKKND